MRGDERPLRYDVPVSLLLHIAVLAALLSLFPPVPLIAPPERVVDIRIVVPPPPPPAAPPETETKTPPPVPAAPARPEPSAPVPPVAPEMVTPEKMLSAAILADPRSAGAVRKLAGLADDERMIQLCTTEAMAQVAAWKAEYRPDMLVAYAMSDLKIAGDRLVADGGAFHSKADWYRIAFECGLARDHASVASFRFKVGEPIPHEMWASHSLPEGSAIAED